MLDEGRLSMNGASERLRERRIEAGPGTELVVSGHSGRVSVNGDDEPTIRVRVREEDLSDFSGREPLAITRDGDQVRVAVNPESGALDLDMDILAPIGCKLRINTLEGGVDVHGLGAAVAIATVDGDVSVNHAQGPCTIETVSGEISLGHSSADITLTTADGDINAHDIEGTLRATVTSGDVRFIRSAFRSINLGAVNGDVTVETSLTADGTYRLSSTNGEIRLLVPAGAGASVRMKTQDGDIRADLPVMQVINSDKRSWQGMLGDGGADVYLESVNGDLRIRQSVGAGFDQPAADRPELPIPPVPPAPVVPPIAPVPPIPPSDPPQHRPSPSPTGRHTHDDAVAVLTRLEQGEISLEEAMADLEELNY
jgi:hypothetical protein